jgi:zinc protease
MSSRLFANLRDKQGLAYSTGVSYGPRASETAFVPYIIALPENADKGIDGILKIFADIRDNGVTDEELDRAKSKELGNFLLGHETADDRAMNLANNAMMGLALDYDQHYPDQIRAVTKEDIQRVAQQYLNYHVISRLDPPQQ